MNCSNRVILTLFITLVGLYAGPATPAAHADALFQVVSEEIGPLVSSQVTEDDVQALAEMCPQADPAAVKECLTQTPDANAILDRVVAETVDGLKEMFGAKKFKRFGEQLLSLSGEQFAGLLESCPKKRSKCLKSELQTLFEQAAVAEAGDDDYPAEALQMLPREVLDALPKIVTKFLKPDDYKVLNETCGSDDLDATLKCLLEGEGLEVLETLHQRNVVDSLLEYMDVDLPKRLTNEENDELADQCEKEGEAWATCGFEKGMDHDDCADGEQALARCLVQNDLIAERYLEVVKDKKEVFGRELYVELAGFMAVIELEDLKDIREGCPQTDLEEAAACLLDRPDTTILINTFQQLAELMVSAANEELAKAGVEFDASAYEEQFFHLFLSMPFQTITNLGTACEKIHPELATLDDPAKLDQMMACIGQASMTDAIANPAYIAPDTLRKWLNVARTKITERLAEKEHAAQVRSSKRVALVLGIVALLGFIGIMLMPLFLRKRYPGRDSLLWRASAVAAGTFVATMVMLGVTLLLMRAVQGSVATDSTSPRMKVAAAVFDVLSQNKYVDDLSELSKYRLDFIKGPLKVILKDVAGDRADDYEVFIAFVATHWAEILQEPEIQRFAENKDTLMEQVGTFKSVIGMYKKVDWLMSIVPIILSLLAVVLYLLPLRQTLIDIAMAPTRVNQQGGQQNMVGQARATVTAEIKSVLPFLGLILLLLPLVGLFLALALKPVIELVLAYAFQTIGYLLTAKASAAVLYASLGGVMLLLIACITVYVLCMAFFTGTVRKILRSRFHYGYAFSDYKRFWLIGGGVLIALLMFPMLYALGANAIFESIEPSEVPSASDMVLIPLISFLLFPLVFWLVRGVRGLGYIKNYPVALAHGHTPGAGPQVPQGPQGYQGQPGPQGHPGYQGQQGPQGQGS